MFTARDNSIQIAMKKFSQRGAILVLSVGLLVIAGWIFNLEILTKIHPSWVSMKSNAALCLILCALAQLFQLKSENRPNLKKYTLISTTIVGAISTMTLVEYLFDTDLGIDNTIIKDLDNSIAHPGRMAPNTANCFLFYTVATFLSFKKSRIAILLSQACILVVGLISFLALVGYIYGVFEFYGLASYASMALHTAFSFFCLFLAFFSARPGAGITEIFVNDKHTAAIGLKLLLFIITVPVAIGWLRLKGQELGLYGTEFGIGLLVTSNIVLIVGLVWRYLSEIAKNSANIKEAKATEERLQLTQKERDFAQSLIQCSLDGIFAYDNKMVFTAWNKAMETMTGVPANKVIGKKATELFPHIVGTPIQKLYERALAGEYIHIQEQEFTYLTTKEKGYYEGNWSPVISSTGQIIGGLTFVRDITLKKHSEAKLREQERLMFNSSRMASLGEMAGGIAHEINTPLSIINLNSAHLKNLVVRKELDAEAITKSAATIESTVFRIAKIVQGLKLFSTVDRDHEMEQSSIGEIIENTLSLCSERFNNSGVKLEVHQNCEDFSFTCRPFQISQIILNLLNNAFDAVQGLQEKWVNLTINTDLKLVTISVTDSGNGIDPSILHQIMTPFFSTKERGKGVGLGLSISKTIAESHSGKLDIDKTSQNTRFVLTLPIAQTVKATRE